MKRRRSGREKEWSDREKEDLTFFLNGAQGRKKRRVQHESEAS